MSCLAVIVKNLQFATTKDENSDSVIVFGTYFDSLKNKIIKNKKGKQVVLKLTHELTQDEKQRHNNLEIERDIYMFVKDDLSLLTPHFAKGILVGSCDLGSLFQDPDNALFNEDFKFKWETSRGYALYFNFDDETKFKFRKKFKKMGQDNFEKEQHRIDLQFYQWLFQIHSKKNPQKVHYVMTKQLEGTSLADFFSAQKNSKLTKEDADELDTSIAIQIAQALASAESKGFIHNNLHFKNIFVKTKKDDYFKINYTYPFEFTLRTKVFVTVFDYNKSYLEGTKENTLLTNKFCKQQGMCNKFIKNYDWYVFLHFYVNNIQRKTILSLLLSKNSHIQNTNLRGCLCIEQDSDLQCKKCINNVKEYENLKSPLTFLREELYHNAKIYKDYVPFEPVQNNFSYKKAHLMNPMFAFKQSDYKSPFEFLNNFNQQQNEFYAKKTN